MSTDLDMRNPSNHWKLGQSRTNPIMICANPGSRSFGDFTASLFFINTVAEHFDHKVLTVLYKDDMDFKSPIMRLLPATYLMPVPSDAPLPSLELFNATAAISSTHDPDAQQWFQSGMSKQHLFITDSMASSSMLWTFDRLSHLRFSESDAAACSAQLIAAGVDPDKWFVTVHCRERGYAGKPGSMSLRDCDPKAFMQAMVHIVRNLGGQVVRLGHPAMTPIKGLERFVDLSREEGNSFLQAFAISRSRFLLGGPSGPSGVASSLNVPHAQINAVDYFPHNPRIVMRTVDLKTPDGKMLSQKDLFDAGYSKVILTKLIKEKAEGYAVFKNPVGELIRVANYVYDMTDDVRGWREPDPPWNGPRPNQILWPGVAKPRGYFLPLQGS